MNAPTHFDAVRALKESLFSRAHHDFHLYAILDGAWCPGLYGQLIGSELDYCNLLEGDMAQATIQECPYLVRLEKDHDFTDWLLKNGWGNGWGLFFLAQDQQIQNTLPPPSETRITKLRERGAFFATPELEHDPANTVLLLRHHFRRFTRVEFAHDGRIVQFRFFDPAVLNIFLRNATLPELEAFFGIIPFFFTDSFSEAQETANPNEARSFSLKITQQHGAKLIVHHFNALKNTVRREEHSINTKTEETKHSSAYFIIGTHIKEAFEEQQRNKFYNDITQDLSTINDTQTAQTHNTPDKIQNFVQQQAQQAKQLKLTTEFDIKGYILCAWRYGEDFANNTTTKNILNNPQQRKSYFLKHGYQEPAANNPSETQNNSLNKTGTSTHG